MSAKFYQAKRILLEERRAGTLINAAGRRAVQSVLLMDNGTVVASCFTMNKLLGNIAKANAKGSEGVNTLPKGNKVRLYIADAEEITAESFPSEKQRVEELIADTIAEDDEDDYDNEGIVLDEEVPDE